MKEQILENLITKYSKKIFGFSLSKTKNVFDAEDLSQEILMNLYEALNKDRKIYNLDAFIYKICFYTWSNYVRRNIDHWQITKGDWISDTKTDEKETDNEFINEIRKRIAYLAGINQKIITMYYYDDIKLVDIAKKLRINENTVRSNLHRTKMKIKEKIKMRNNLHFKPISMNIGFDGNAGIYNNITNLLGQNILYACYKEAKTIEEIADAVQVASCYLEEYLQQFLFHDWMTLNNKKYQTNFFIYDHKYKLAETKSIMNNIENLAVPIYKMALENFASFTNIINGESFSDEALLYFFTGYFSQYLWEKFIDEYLEENIDTNFMIREDGYKYALFAELGEDVSIDDEILRKYFINRSGMVTNRTYGRIHRGLAISEVNRNCKLNSIVFGANASIYDTYELELIYNLIKNESIPNEREKVILSKYIKEEVITIVDSKPKWKVIFMEKEAAEQFFELLEKMKTTFNKEVLVDYLLTSKEVCKEFIPKHLSEEMINYYSTNIMVTSPILYYLHDSKRLRLPESKECKTASEWFYIHN